MLPHPPSRGRYCKRTALDWLLSTITARPPLPSSLESYAGFFHSSITMQNLPLTVFSPLQRFELLLFLYHVVPSSLREPEDWRGDVEIDVDVLVAIAFLVLVDCGPLVICSTSTLCFTAPPMCFIVHPHSTCTPLPFMCNAPFKILPQYTPVLCWAPWRVFH
jgi:hypothetical protein